MDSRRVVQRRAPAYKIIDATTIKPMFPPMAQDMTFDFPFVADLPKREARPVVKLWDELKEFEEMVRQDGAAIPVTFAAKLLNVSRQRVYDLCETGRLRRVELGGHSFITSESLVEWARAEHKSGRPAGVLKDGAGVVGLVKPAFDYAREVVAARPKKGKEKR